MNPDDAMIAATIGSEPLVEAPPVKKYNTQLYENSRLSGSAIEQHYEEQADALYGDRKPNLVVEHEQPMHRAVIFLKAQGLSNNEIARRTGFSPPWISQVLRQPWARLRLIQELTTAGRDAVSTLIKASAEDSVYTLIEVRDNPKSKGSEKIAAANALLDRQFGKPTQHVETQITNVTSAASIEELDAKIKETEEEIKNLTGN